MKHKLLLTIIALFAMQASKAQLESGFVPSDFTSYEGIDFAAGTIVSQSSSVTWSLAGDDTFRSVAMAGESDPANAVVIGNSTFYMFPGIQGAKNGKDIGSAYPGIQGSEQKLTVSADGMMYVFIKGSYNKGYYVYEGSLPDNTGFPVAYQMTCNPVDGSGIYSYKLAEDNQGYGWADQTDFNYWESEGKILKPTAMPGSTWQAGNALCVIAFPAYYEGQEYYVWCSGSKLIMDGFVFDKGATSAQEISFAKVDEGEITPIDPTPIDPTPVDPDPVDPSDDKPMGDVNNDGEVNSTDVVVLIDYILGMYPDNFNMEAADINKDGNVSVTDAVMLIDMVLYKTDM